MQRFEERSSRSPMLWANCLAVCFVASSGMTQSQGQQPAQLLDIHGLQARATRGPLWTDPWTRQRRSSGTSRPLSRRDSRLKLAGACHLRRARARPHTQPPVQFVPRLGTLVSQATRHWVAAELMAYAHTYLFCPLARAHWALRISSKFTLGKFVASRHRLN